jgi:hypothetical protein
MVQMIQYGRELVRIKTQKNSIGCSVDNVRKRHNWCFGSSASFFQICSMLVVKPFSVHLKGDNVA